MFARACLWMVLGCVVALGSACVTSNASRCTSDVVCPSGMSCAPSGASCVDTDLVEACQGTSDGQSCLVAGFPPGTCFAGICQASRCGDARVTGTEECDGDVLASKTCQAFGFYEPTGLRCNAECRYDTSQCSGRCGDGIKNGAEQCDGTDLAKATCFTAGFYAAPGLTCKPNCMFDVAACTGGRCGDGVINALEQCDGAKFATTCALMGFAGAMSGLSCSDSCTFTTTSCLCSAGARCKAKTQRCECDKLGGCGCVAVR
ncbi:MAG: hypothetical protein H7138_26180 [Myxococcales bacterium]|nr:hypothetical protein [Myxococcales bacterium]